ncbi:beta-defensin 135 [Otolemur garnettii]|uniref:beta-defensin 135 n=1 Tax=Otolemur garnettii TaxID=30611 RepID=UPI000C7EDFB5|nr:beta-defensin 135 [Otolemur garnettii]
MRLTAVSLLIGIAMRGALLVLVVLVLLSCVPPVRSGPNAYIRKVFTSCWRMEGVCRPKCEKTEIYHILCDTTNMCCIEKKHLPKQPKPAG